MTPEQLRKKALALGAEVEIGGERFNTARQQMKTRPRPALKVVPALPAPPPPEYLTRQEVKSMLDDLNEAWEQRMDILLATLQKPPPPPPEWDFKVDYMRSGAIENIRAVPRKPTTT